MLVYLWLLIWVQMDEIGVFFESREPECRKKSKLYDEVCYWIRITGLKQQQQQQKVGCDVSQLYIVRVWEIIADKQVQL